ncbi:MAG: hypothetical protein ABIP64_08565, partial [Burkholderiales bacterium]
GRPLKSILISAAVACCRSAYSLSATLQSLRQNLKGPVLRGLAARAPYFHNGFAADLNEAVDFCNTRFSVELSDEEKSDLVAFLRAL